MPVQVTAGVNPLERAFGSPRRLIVWPADLKHSYPRFVDRRFLCGGNAREELLALTFNQRRRKAARRFELRHRRRRFERRVWTLVTRRQTFVHSRDRSRDPVISGVDSDSELLRLASKLLTLDFIKRRGSRRIEFGALHLAAVNPESDLKRI